MSKITTANATSEFSQRVALTSPAPREAIQILLSDVANLVAQGVLNRGEGNALSSTLQAALQQLERGKRRPAASQIQAFINQVDALMRSRRLSPQQGQALIDAAMDALAELNR